MKAQLQATSSAYTPGPWTVESWASQVWLLDSKGNYLAKMVLPDEENQHSGPPNIHLMGSASEMFEALKLVIEWAKIRKWEGFPSAKVEKALAKAQGGC
jgi:hypothetical protein